RKPAPAARFSSAKFRLLELPYCHALLMQIARRRRSAAVKVSNSHGALVSGDARRRDQLIARSGKGSSMNVNTAERVTDIDGAAFEGEIREFIRKDMTPARRVSAEGSEFAVNNVNSLVQRVAGTSLQEIDNLVVELQNLRDFLVSEGERVQREIAGYGEL